MRIFELLLKTLHGGLEKIFSKLKNSALFYSAAAFTLRSQWAIILHVPHISKPFDNAISCTRIRESHESSVFDFALCKRQPQTKEFYAAIWMWSWSTNCIYISPNAALLHCAALRCTPLHSPNHLHQNCARLVVRIKHESKSRLFQVFCHFPRRSDKDKALTLFHFAVAQQKKVTRRKLCFKVFVILFEKQIKSKKTLLLAYR